MKPKVQFHDLGPMDYKQAWDLQEELFAGIVSQKVANRDDPGQAKTPPNYLLFCEHPHVYTLGKSGSMENLLIDEAGLDREKISFYKINRGGDITYHGPGQIVGYPLLDLDQFFTDIHKYLRYLEEAVIKTLAEYGIRGGRLEGFTGVWLDEDDPDKARKICAMGVRCSRWVTMHGLAFNVNTDLGFFDHIVPCGIDDKAVTSMKHELGHEVDREEVASKLRHHLSELFGWEEEEMREIPQV